MIKPYDTVVGSLANSYSNSPAIKALLNLLPLWSSADGLLETRAGEIKRQRLRFFFDALADGQREITQKLIESDDFLHCYFKTTEVVLNTRRKEKIELFARMLRVAMNAQVFTGLDQYEELLDTLDSMSFREFGVLLKLKGYEARCANKSFKNDYAKIKSYEDEFTSDACKTFEIEKEEFDPFMERLQRTGLYIRLDPAWAEDPVLGKTTRQFEKLCGLVQREA